jgi:hypothetical protein
MVHAKGPTWRSCSKVLTALFTHGDQSPDDIERLTGIDRKTVFAVLNLLRKDPSAEKHHGGDELLKRISTGERNKVKYHLPEKNYAKAMARCGWPRERWRTRYSEKLEQIHKYLASKNDNALRLLEQIPLTPKAKAYMMGEGLTHQFVLDSRLQSLREGSFCLRCFNEGRGFRQTVLDAGAQYYVCEECGMEQEPFSGGERQRKDPGSRTR